MAKLDGLPCSAGTLKKVTRRQILVATATASALGYGVIADSEPNTSPHQWTLTADVVVVGSGAAAYAAACTAASKGLSVVMLEKGVIYGGTTAKSGAQYWIPNNSMMRRHGLQDPEEWALKLMARLSWPTLYDPSSPTLGLAPHDHELMQIYYRRGPESVDYLAALGALEPRFASFATMGGSPESEDDAIEAWPDYAADLPECKAPYGRTLCPINGGGAMIKTFKKSADAQGVRLFTEHRVNQLYQDDHGRVIGVGAEFRGTQVAVRAARGVIFGSGGFTHNPELRNNFLRGFVLNGCAVPTNTGDFVSLASAAGAELGNMNNAWWLEQPLEVALTAPGASSEVFFLPGDSMIAVNRHGVRVVNEKISYNERSQVHFYYDAVTREYPNFVTFMIYDEATANREWSTYTTPPYPIPPPGVEAPYVIKGQTIDELAANIQARLAKLATHTGGFSLAPGFAKTFGATLKTFNQYAASGVDPDFHRGGGPQQLMMSGPGRPGNSMKNQTMHPISTSGPYYCVPLIAGTLDTKGGPKIDGNGRILDGKSKPIRGLYGAGNCVSSPTAQAYWSGGATIGCAIIFGYLAGLHASVNEAV